MIIQTSGMRLLLILLTVLFLVAVTHVEGKKQKKGPKFKCSTCEDVVTNFRKGLKRTRRSSFGGGDSKWERTNLGDYSNSELRLVEIMDDLCAQSTEECPSLLEEYEELIEEFWFNEDLENDADVFHNYFCIENVKACCPNNTYGPSCKECAGGVERPCKGNGYCDGAGTRGGTGKCKCKLGYKGKLCDVCDDRHYETDRNETHTVCTACHKSCKKKCTGEGPLACDGCTEGWKYVKGSGCKDLNECLDKPCDQKEYCSNNEGSYSCHSCSIACESCFGEGHHKCLNCSFGFGLKDFECLDLDECHVESDGSDELCLGEGELCENTPGSYKCVCQSGYVKNDMGSCVLEETLKKPRYPSQEEEIPDVVVEEEKKVPECSACKEVVTNFKLGLERTKRSSYEGGNTNWEENNLGRYADSEMRLVEIVDGICVNASQECPQVMEDYEDFIEQFWLNSGLEKEPEAFYQYFCIDKVQACCPNNTYGPTCTQCFVGVDRPCKGNGECDGEGTRKGTGKCNCTLGYEGEVCDSCTEGFFETFKNDTHTVCTACHPSCKKCTGESHMDCEECNLGWTLSDENGCEDFNECEHDPCEDFAYCNNTEGFFSCQSCDPACGACYGPGNDKCRWCKDGYYLKNKQCLDVDECESDMLGDLCTAENEMCKNIPGSYSCECKPGYVDDAFGTCVVEVIETDEDDGRVGVKVPKVNEDPAKNLGDQMTKDATRDEL